MADHLRDPGEEVVVQSDRAGEVAWLGHVVDEEAPWAATEVV